jgi:serine/threonine protein kinase
MNERELFIAALSQSAPNERAAYLAKACGEDVALREHLDALLREHDQLDSFLESPATGLPGTGGLPFSSERPGTQIGPYKLLEQIGEGGFGVVYLAEQERPVRRKVALKVIKPGMDTRHVIARFEAERQALALMDHPNIAKVFDAGTTNVDRSLRERNDGSRSEPTTISDPGRPYFVMELVQGVPITDYSDECNLTTRERLELFITVCQAVQHAHQKGIIHRDIKPSNVLVAMQDGKPIPKIIDFGVAKAINQQLTEHTLATGYQQIVGTPLYMSPEQAELSPLGVDTRSDIYSLGVMLYELLTGTTPFEKERLQSSPFDELRRIIREEEPPRPSARISTLFAALASTVAQRRRSDTRRLTQLVRGDLDWIVMKCLEKDRNRRYESASALAQEVQRYLDNQPVDACPPSAAYRMHKFVRRNKALVVAATMIALLVLVGSTSTTWQAVRATQAETQAIHSQRQSHQAIDDWFVLVSEDDALRNEPALQPLRKKMLERAIVYFETFIADEHTRPELRAQKAVACFRIAIVTYESGTGENWLPRLEQGVAIVEKLLEEKHDLSVFESLQSGQRWIDGATYRSSIPDFDQAGPIVDRARVAWEELVRRFPTVAGFQNDLAAFCAIAAALTEATDVEQSLGLYAKAIGIWQNLANAHPEAPHYRAALVNTLPDSQEQATI